MYHQKFKDYSIHKMVNLVIPDLALFEFKNANIFPLETTHAINKV